MVQDRNRLIEDVTRNVPGSLSGDSCRKLFNIVKFMPKDGVVLDLNCGHGRSTIVVARAMEMLDKSGGTVLAVDTHVTDAMSSTPYEDGTLMPFLKYLRLFKVLRRVTPLIAPTSVVPRMLNKKCANIVVVQPGGHDLPALIRDAQFAIRTGGTIIVFSDHAIDHLFAAADFKKIEMSEGAQAWTATGAKDK